MAAQLEICNAELAHLEKFMSIPRLDQLKKRHDKIKRALRRKIFKDYREIGQVLLLHVILRTVLTTEYRLLN